MLTEGNAGTSDFEVVLSRNRFSNAYSGLMAYDDFGILFVIEMQSIKNPESENQSPSLLVIPQNHLGLAPGDLCARNGGSLFVTTIC